MKNYYIMNTKTLYTSPETTHTLVEMEGQICAGSEVTKINSGAPNVEVDKWDSIENGVTFD